LAGPQSLTPPAIVLNNMEINDNKEKGPPLVSRISRSVGPENMPDDHHHHQSGRVSKSGDVKKMLLDDRN